MTNTAHRRELRHRRRPAAHLVSPRPTRKNPQTE
jgi:hypothetical protein